MQIIDLKSRLRILRLQLKRQPGSKLDNPQSLIPIVSAEVAHRRTPSHTVTQHKQSLAIVPFSPIFAHFQPPQKSMSESGRPFSG